RRLFGQFVENAVHVGPIKTDVGRAPRELMPLEQRRQAAWNSIKNRRDTCARLRIPAFGALLGLELLPILQDLRRSLRAYPAEDVRMAAHHFRMNPPDNVGDVEFPRLGAELRVKDDLQQQIA